MCSLWRELLIHSWPSSPALDPTSRKISHSPFRWPIPARQCHGNGEKEKMRSSTSIVYSVIRGEFYCSPSLVVLFIVLSHFLFPFLGHTPSLQLLWFTHPGRSAVISPQRLSLPLRDGSESATWKDKVLAHSQENTLTVLGFSECLCLGPEARHAWRICDLLGLHFLLYWWWGPPFPTEAEQVQFRKTFCQRPHWKPCLAKEPGYQTTIRQ